MSNSAIDLSKEFGGRRALITGGSRGIGAAIAQRLLDGGAKVAVVARNRHEQTPAGATFIKGDILTLEGCKQLVEESVKALGGLDILVNNAAEAKLVLPNSEAISDELWQRTIASNLLSVVRVTNAALPALKESTQGSILNISSGSDLPGNGPLVHYGASKARDELLHEGYGERTGCCSQDSCEHRYSWWCRNSWWRHHPQRAHGRDGCSTGSRCSDGSVGTSWYSFRYRRGSGLPAFPASHLDYGAELTCQRRLLVLTECIAKISRSQMPWEREPFDCSRAIASSSP